MNRYNIPYFIVLVGLFIVAEGCSTFNHNGSTRQDIIIKVMEDDVSGRLTPQTNAVGVYKFLFLDTHSIYERTNLMAFFHNSDPAVICGLDRLTYGENGIPLDRVTRSRVLVFKVTIDSLTLSMARATSVVYSGNTGAESVHYTLMLKNNEWIIIKKELGPMS